MIVLCSWQRSQSSRFPMTLPKSEAERLLQQMIFDDQMPQEWVMDVWDMSPTLGETAAKLVDGFRVLLENCSEEKLDNIVRSRSDSAGVSLRDSAEVSLDHPPLDQN